MFFSSLHYVSSVLVFPGDSLFPTTISYSVLIISFLFEFSDKKRNYDVLLVDNREIKINLIDPRAYVN